MFDLILSKTVDTADTVKDIPNIQVVLIGVGTVFAGLICIVILCKIIGLICGKTKSKEKITATSPAFQVQAAVQPIPDRQKVIAAVATAVAEELGTDVSAIRILSFKKI